MKNGKSVSDSTKACKKKHKNHYISTLYPKRQATHNTLHKHWSKTTSRYKQLEMTASDEFTLIRYQVTMMKMMMISDDDDDDRRRRRR